MSEVQPQAIKENNFNSLVSEVQDIKENNVKADAHRICFLNTSSSKPGDTAYIVLKRLFILRARFNMLSCRWRTQGYS